VRLVARLLFKHAGDARPFTQRQCLGASLKINLSLAEHDAGAAMTFDDLLERRRRVS
jgi:hypothetical protein